MKKGMKSVRKMISSSCKVFVGNISYRVSAADWVWWEGLVYVEGTLVV